MWYDFFSLFYDYALEDLYAPYRAAVIEALQISPGDCILDLPCGTGQSFSLLVDAVGPNGVVFGIDNSRGMLRRAKRRIARAGWNQIILEEAPATHVNASMLERKLGRPDVDGLLCALGLTALPRWEATFDRMFSLIRPGGRFVLLDVYGPNPSLKTHGVELVARADLSRKAWRPLENHSSDFERIVLSSDQKTFGGELYIACGTHTP